MGNNNGGDVANHLANRRPDTYKRYAAATLRHRQGADRRSIDCDGRRVTRDEDFARRADRSIYMADGQIVEG